MKAVLNRFPIALKVFVAPSAVILLMLMSVLAAQVALERHQKVFLQVVSGPLETSTSTTKLLLAVAQVHSDVVRYAQLRQRMPAGEKLLEDLARSIDEGYTRIDRLFAEIKKSTAGSGEADAVANISDFLIIHRAVARRIVTGESTGTVAISTLLAHHQQLQSYVVELASRTLASSQAIATTTANQVNTFIRYLAVGAFAAVVISVLLTFYIGRAIAKPITGMINALNDIAAGNYSVSIAGTARRDEIGDMARAAERFASVSRELQQREQALKEASAQAEAASQHKSQFLASMSHELRTPLNAILGFNEMMLDGLYGELPGDLKEPLDEMQKSGQLLLRLINNVLDLAKIEAGRMELALADYSAHDIVENVRATLRPLAESKGLALGTSVPADLPLGYGDPGRLTQCLMNLVGNSLKFTKEGQVNVGVELDGGTQLRYRVTDTGIGIPPDKIGSLFTEFKQTDATIASEYGGTGLGLSITKKFVEMHGGRIWVESVQGEGSAFIFEIPLRVSG